MKIYLDASMEAVYGRLAGRHRFNAGMAEVDMHLLRNEDYSGSTPDSRSTFEESE